MLCIISVANRGRIVGIACVAMLFGLLAIASPIMAQSNSDNLPPWQQTPGKGSEFRIPAVKKVAYEPAPQSAIEGEDSPTQKTTRTAPLTGSVLDDNYETPNHEVVSGPEEPILGGDEECTDCNLENCLNPFANRLWVRGEFLTMFGKSPSIQPLATTSTAGTTRPSAGLLGVRSTQILFGRENEDLGIMPGARFTLGYKIKPCEESGLEVSYMFLGNNSLDFSVSSDTTPIIARPFWNVQTALQDALIVAFPGQQTGSMNIKLTNEFHTLELLWRQAMYTESGRRLDFLAGYRYGHFAETLEVGSRSTFISQVGVIPVGTISQVSDEFAAKNDFHGGEVGFATKMQYCRWSVELLGKLAMGNTRSQINITGVSSITTPPNPAVTSRGGLLALPSNFTTIEENGLSVMPELGLTVGYDLTCRLRATLGYSFLYWSRVARPTDQIDLNINPSQLSGGTLSGTPAPQFRYTPGDYWIQGLTFGLDYRF